MFVSVALLALSAPPRTVYVVENRVPVTYTVTNRVPGVVPANPYTADVCPGGCQSGATCTGPDCPANGGNPAQNYGVTYPAPVAVRAVPAVPPVRYVNVGTARRPVWQAVQASASVCGPNGCR